MKLVLSIITVVLLTGCNSSSNKSIPVDTTDTATEIVTDNNAVLVDTEDHNRGVTSTVALDSPVGAPPPSLDSIYAK